MNDKEKKFTVISNKKVIKRFAAVADSNISSSSEKIDEPKQLIQEEKPFILSKNNLVKETNTILENQTTIKKPTEEIIIKPAVVKKSNKKFTGDNIPYITSEPLTITLLEDSLHQPIAYIDATIEKTNWKKYYSQPTDSMLKIMMHRSDNFYAEQSLLMIGNEKLGKMDDGKTIDTLLKTDFKLLPQKPKWVDGSGLSRYNLMTPQDFVWVLNQIKTEFGWQRTSTIFQEANSGTLGGYYKNINGKLFAKTGTLSNVVTLSGYITTAKGKEIIFSVLVNQHQSSASEIRRIVEQFLVGVIEKN